MILGHRLLAPRPGTTCFVYRGGAQRNLETDRYQHRPAGRTTAALGISDIFLGEVETIPGGGQRHLKVVPLKAPSRFWPELVSIVSILEYIAIQTWSSPIQRRLLV